MKNVNLLPGNFYHVFNQGVNKENLFFEKKNYYYFFKLYEKYIVPVTDTYAYCLLKNHFHLLIKIKNSDLNVIQQFSNFFNSYTKSVNKMYKRSGSLFTRKFKRIHVNNIHYLIQLISYIHKNPEKHGFVKNYKEYPFSSYLTVLSDKKSKIKKQDVLKWFSGLKGFKKYHNLNINDINIEPLLLE